MAQGVTSYLVAVADTAGGLIWLSHHSDLAAATAIAADRAKEKRDGAVMVLPVKMFLQPLTD